MNRLLVLPLLSAALLLVLTSDQLVAQSGVGSSISKTNVARRTHAIAPSRNVPPSSELRTAPTLDEPAESHHKSWKDLAHAKTDGKSDKPAAINSSWSALGALIIVVGLILVVARLLRQHTPMFQQSLPTDALEILGRRVVDPRQSILLVRIGSRILVVGSSPNGLNSLGQVDDAVEVDVLAGLCRRGPQSSLLGTSFFKLLKGDSGNRPAPSAKQPAHRAPISEPPITGSLESPEERTSQPEYDLVRRLRKSAAAAPAGGRERV
jgi:flagellar biogenesis protein FliO